MDLRALINKMDQLAEASDPAEYARAQQQMDRLEKAAQYTGDDEIVRYRMGLPAKLPPIEQWDGKMPKPTGKPDWLSRLTTLGKATDTQTAAVTANQADDASTAEYKAKISKAKELIIKIKAALGTATAESVNFKSSIAHRLSESFGYKLLESKEEAKLMLDELGKIVQSFGSTEDPEMLDIARQYSELTNAMNAPAKPAETPAAGSGDTKEVPGVTTNTLASTQAAETSAKFKSEKLARLKEITAKLKALNPLNADPISQNALPKTSPEQSATPKPAASTAGAAASNASASGSSYAVKPGDTLSKIAAANKTTVDAIMKANPQIKDANKISAGASLTLPGAAKENMSEAEKYAAIRDRLAAIESRVDEASLDEITGLVKGAYNAGKGIFQAAKTGFSGAPVATGQLTKSGATQMTGQGSQKFAKQLATMPAAQRGAYNAAQAVKNNPGKTAVGALAAGSAAGYALSGDPTGQAATPAAAVGSTAGAAKEKIAAAGSAAAGSAAAGSAAAGSAAAGSAAGVENITTLTAEIDAIEKELMSSDGSAFQDDPEIQKAIADARASLNPLGK